MKIHEGKGYVISNKISCGDLYIRGVIDKFAELLYY